MQRAEIINARVALNLSLEQMRDATHVSLGTLSRFENGKRVSRPVAERICRALQMPVLDDYIIPRRLKKVRG